MNKFNSEKQLNVDVFVSQCNDACSANLEHLQLPKLDLFYKLY